MLLGSLLYVATMTWYISSLSVARTIQKHQRLLTLLESLDSGKLIREARDTDLPLVVRHFYHHAGWAQLMEVEMKDWKPLGELDWAAGRF